MHLLSLSKLRIAQHARHLHGYTLKKVEDISELNIRAHHLIHETGAEHLHIENKDSNNVFGVSLRTPPQNSTGVAHILEHLALCGSQKYPVRDPYMKMLTRSLATFMNAMTGPDFTAYPFSTQNKKDFENLFKIYMDAVFHPRLKPVDFRQEGWRLEHDVVEDRNTPLIIKGVVYNEMKGLFSSASTIYGRFLQNHLLPDTIYQYESGGDPDVIPSLTHDHLKRFHRIYYHPTNAKFYTYGDIPLEDHLKLINPIIQDFKANPQAREQSLVQEQEFWTEPRNRLISCPNDPLSATPDKQTTTSISYLLETKVTNYDEMFSLRLLSTLLIEGPDAPFSKNLKESGMGSDYSPSTGLNDYIKNPFFSVGLQGVHKVDVEKVHRTIERTLSQVGKDGFPQERVDAILHNIELGLKHVSSNFGLLLMMSVGSAWNHDGNPLEFFRINDRVQKFKDNLSSNKNYWGDLIAKYFNNHKLILTMSPDPDFEKKRDERERRLLENKVSELTETDRQRIYYEGIELKKMQDTKDDLSLLPCLEPSKDISKDLKHRANILFNFCQDVEVQTCEQPTNEVIYFRALFDVSEKLEAVGLLDYLPLFCEVATKMGAGNYNRHELDRRIRLTTGGLGMSVLINPSLSEFDKFKIQILIDSHCLQRNTRNMFELWSNVFRKIHFDDNKDYLDQQVKEMATDRGNNIAHIGNMYAIKKSSSSLSNLSSLDERLSGLSFVARMKDMASQESIDDIAANLKMIANIVMNSSMKCALNAEPQAMKSTMDELEVFIGQTQPNNPSAINYMNHNNGYEMTKVDDLEFHFSTHYVAKSIATIPKSHQDYPKLVIASRLVSMKYLLREIREKRGAYGAGARLSQSGIFSFSSYRDPNTTETLQVFDDSVDWLVKGENFTDSDIEESKLSVFQDVDRPVEPGKRGLNHFLTGESDEMRQEYRQRLLATTKEDVMLAAEKYLTQEATGTFIL